MEQDWAPAAESLLRPPGQDMFSSTPSPAPPELSCHPTSNTHQHRLPTQTRTLLHVLPVSPEQDPADEPIHLQCTTEQGFREKHNLIIAPNCRVGRSHLHLVSSSNPGAEVGRHIKGQEAGAGVGGQEGGELRGKSGQSTRHALDASRKN